MQKNTELSQQPEPCLRRACAAGRPLIQMSKLYESGLPARIGTGGEDGSQASWKDWKNPARTERYVRAGKPGTEKPFDKDNKSSNPTNYE